MTFRRLLIANRGEIAVRIARTAADMGIETVAIYSSDDRLSSHVTIADQACEIAGVGAAAYLNGQQIIDVAVQTGCDAVHPGYGFLSENAAFARDCGAQGLKFIGPNPDHLDLFGDKGAARVIAEKCNVALITGTEQATSLPDMEEFFKGLGAGAAVMIKAVSGGGGRGMRAVYKFEDLPDAFARCQSEAQAAFGKGDVYIEQLVKRPRHIEIQIIGDGQGGIAHLGDRECTIQRRHQKVIEIAPSPSLSDDLRDRMIADAVKIAREVQYEGLGTFEFLLDEDSAGQYYFIEANPRIQVEHTITEEIFAVDLVAAQIRVASGLRLSDIGFEQKELGYPRGFALQLRVNMEQLNADGTTTPSGGILTGYDVPSGPGVRIDGFGYQGYETNPHFDSLLAKVIVFTRSHNFEEAVHKAYRAIREFRIDGVETNIPFLQNILCHPDFIANKITTGFIQDNLSALIPAADQGHRNLFVTLGKTGAKASDEAVAVEEIPAGCSAILSPMQGVIVDIAVSVGDAIAVGQSIAFFEAMKMEHEIKADVSGYVAEIHGQPGDAIKPGQLFLVIREGDVTDTGALDGPDFDIDAIRPDLAEVLERQAATKDAARPTAVEKRRKTGSRTARENIEDFVDDGSFAEYGSLVVAAQKQRRSMKELIEKSPADGLITGTATVNRHLFGDEHSRCMILSYDYSVFAGTQGFMGHKKKDRMLDIARKWKIPLILFSEGGGGRPGDTDYALIVESPSFIKYARLSGLVPLVGIVSGYCFAGNAALLGCSDVIIATKSACIGMAGPAMIEGGGLGVYKPTEVGPVEVQVPNGVIDILVEDEAEAVKASQKYISYFQGKVDHWEEHDQRLLRHIIPENRVRTYDVREVITIMSDKDSVLELREKFGLAVITSFIRIEGQPFGVIASNNRVLGGAIDSPSADKAARFMRLCNAFQIPIINLCDTPGFMVGPEAEKTAQVRHFSRIFVAAANCQVPILCVVLRKAYGLGALAMTGGSLHAPLMNVSWPTGEFGGMGLEGGVRLAYRDQLAAIEDPVEREKKFKALVDEQYQVGKALNVATLLEFDNVIDPMETRQWLIQGLRSVAGWDKEQKRIQGSVDTW